MCGIAGCLSLGPPVSRAIAAQMANQIAHRGPDGEGLWVSEASGIALAHRRLSIVDLSASADQPMVSVSGRYVIVFNGEIYNHKSLRYDLEKANAIGTPWRGHSDTETLLACFETWGVANTLHRTVGMFAFAIWDQWQKELILVRDRYGEKPLYYGWQGLGRDASFLFGSELAALQEHPDFSAEISRDSLACYMRHGYVGEPASIYEGIYKLPPGYFLTVSASEPVPKITKWWSAVAVAYSGASNRFSGSPAEAVDALDILLKDVITQQMVADVSVGAFLSGGIDSSTIAAFMQANSAKRINTFSIGAHEKNYNEANYAKKVASYLGTDHSELYITPDQAVAVIAHLPEIYSEPFADSSQIPTILLSQLAHQKVKVALTGDGGDEMFCGYSRYIATARFWNSLDAFPLSARSGMARIIRAIPPAAWDNVGKLFSIVRMGDRAHKAGDLIASRDVEALYRGMVSQWPDQDSLVIGANEAPSHTQWDSLGMDKWNNHERMMLMDISSYLPGDLLVKVDRAAMSVGLETRAPFLDHRITEFVWSLPSEFKLRKELSRYVSKWILREVLYRYVPRHLVDRPKMGFGIPLDNWLRGPLRAWAESLLDESRLRAEGYLRVQPIRQKWVEHLSGRRNWQHQLWNVLMFQSWLEHQQRR